MLRGLVLAGTLVGLAMAASVAQAAPDLIEHRTSHLTNGMKTESWNDRTLQNDRLIVYGPGGQVMTQVASSIKGRTWTNTHVNHSSRTWYVTEHTFPVATVAGGGSAVVAETYRRMVRVGTWTVVARGELAGRATTQLRQTMVGLAKGHIDTWVDSLTYLPLRQVSVGTIGGRTTRNESESEWLARTPANLAETVLDIPAGFKKTHRPSGSSTSTLKLATTTAG